VPLARGSVDLARGRGLRLEQLLTGGAPRQVTNFTSGLIFDFAWTRDGKDLLVARGELTSDVVLISNFRQGGELKGGSLDDSFWLRKSSIPREMRVDGDFNKAG
jgi:hypothetical protein